MSSDTDLSKDSTISSSHGDLERRPIYSRDLLDYFETGQRPRYTDARDGIDRNLSIHDTVSSLA